MTDQPTVNDGEPRPNDTPTTPRQSAPFRSSVTARPDARLNGNSPAGRRVRDLYRALMTRLNDPADIVVQADIMAWAELKAAAEVARASVLEKGQSSNECVRLENLVRRAEARVGLALGAAAAEQDTGPSGLFIDDDDDAEDLPA
jgi:hypothetical protein